MVYSLSTGTKGSRETFTWPHVSGRTIAMLWRPPATPSSSTSPPAMPLMSILQEQPFWTRHTSLLVQQVHYPHNPLQPGPMYFKTARKCAMFGVCCEGVPRQVNYLLDEASDVGTGANTLSPPFLSTPWVGGDQRWPTCLCRPKPGELVGHTCSCFCASTYPFLHF